MNRPLLLFVTAATLAAQPQSQIVLHAARVLNIETGNITAPGEILIQGDRIGQSGLR